MRRLEESASIANVTRALALVATCSIANQRRNLRTPSLFDFGSFDHTALVFEVLVGEICGCFAAVTNRKEALRVEFGDSL